MYMTPHGRGWGGRGMYVPTPTVYDELHLCVTPHEERGLEGDGYLCMLHPMGGAWEGKGIYVCDTPWGRGLGRLGYLCM